MPKTKDFYQRIEIIDECLRQKGKKWNIDDLLACVNQQLVDRLEEPVSKRTIQYSLDYLINEKGAPIAKTRTGVHVLYYYEDVNYSIKNLPLSDEEIVFLKDAVGLIKQIGNISIAKDIVSVIQKLENTIAKNPVSDRTVIQFERQSTSTGLEHFDNVFTGIKEKITLRISYQPFGKEAYEQIVHPYLLKEYRNRWFLIAMDHNLKKISTLALDRVKTVKPSNEAFIENNLFDPDTYFNNLVGVTFPEGEQVSDVTLKVSAAQVPYIKTKPIHVTQEVEGPFEDGSVLVRLRLINNYELKSILLSYGADIEVLEPLALRDQLKAVFNAGYSIYH